MVGKKISLPTDPDVRFVFQSYPKPFREKLLVLRGLILCTAEEIAEVGKIEETLRWGEPSYLTTQTGSGSLIRIHWKKSKPNYYGIYFHCATTLISDFKKKYGALFKYEGNRGILFEQEDFLAVNELRECFQKALTYHLNK